MADTKISAASRLTGTGIVKRPVVLAGNATAFSIADNYEATTDPAVTDDDGDGYSIGSIWQRKDTGRRWFCRDASTGAAKWVKMGGAMHPGYVSGRWYQPAPFGRLTAGQSFGTGSIRFYPFVLTERVTISDLGARVTTLAASGNCQFAVYGADPATGLPTGNALAVTAGISVASTGVVSGDITGANVALEPGLYWMAVNVDASASGVVIFQTPNPDGAYPSWLHGSSSHGDVASSSGGVFCRFYNQTYGTWPDMTGQSTTITVGASYAFVQFKVA